jgi:hypothetical protein
MTIEDMEMTDQELAERDLLDMMLEERGSVVFLAYGANSQAGLFSKGFARITQLDGDGHIRWDHWESLPNLSELGGEPQKPVRPHLRLVDPGSTSPRFDAANDSDDDLGIRPRLPAEGEQADAETGEGEAGSAEAEE